MTREEPLSEDAQKVLAALDLEEGRTAADIIQNTSGLLLLDQLLSVLKDLHARRLVQIDNTFVIPRYKLTVRGVRRGGAVPELTRMALNRHDRHAIYVALIIAIDNASRFADAEDQSPDGIKIREEYPRQWRQLLDRFSD